MFVAFSLVYTFFNLKTEQFGPGEPKIRLNCIIVLSSTPRQRWVPC